jgi:hypothetical protein
MRESLLKADFAADKGGYPVEVVRDTLTVLNYSCHCPHRSIQFTRELSDSERALPAQRL